MNSDGANIILEASARGPLHSVCFYVQHLFNYPHGKRIVEVPGGGGEYLPAHEIRGNMIAYPNVCIVHVLSVALSASFYIPAINSK